MLVAAVEEFELALTLEQMDLGHARIDGVTLVPGVADRVVLADAHHLGLYEERVLKLRLRRIALVLRVVVVHEQERPGLDFAEHAAGSLEHQAAGAGAGHQVHRDSRAFDQFAGRDDGLHHAGDRIAPLLRRAQVLCPAVVGLQSREAQRRMLSDFMDQRHRRLAGTHPAAALSDVDLHEHVDHCRDASARAPFVHRLRQPADALDAVHRDGELAVFGCQLVGQRGHPRQLVRGHHLVADVHAMHAAGSHRFGLGRFLDADPDRASLHLQLGQRRTLVHLRVWAPADVVFLGEFRHPPQVALHRIEVEHQRRRVDRVHAQADQRPQRFRKRCFRRQVHH